MSTWTTEDREEAEKVMNNKPALKGEPSRKAEPIAWMVETSDDITFMLNVKGASKPDNSWDKVIPVYTHPAKTLTDEEILQEAYYILMREQQRKAQEK